MGSSEEVANITLSWNISAEASISAENVDTINSANLAQCQLYTFIVNGILMGLLCLAGIVGNIISFIVFWKDKVKTSTSFLFQGLSFIDTCLLITCIPLYVVITLVEYGGWKGYDNVHVVVLVFGYPLAMVIQTTTIWVTVLVALNRYIAVCMPYQAARLCTVPQARKQLAIVVVITILYNLPRFFEAKIEVHTTDFNQTSLRPQYTALGENANFRIIYSTILYIIFLLVLPLIILTFLNIRLIKALNEIRRRRAEMQSLRQQQDNNVTLVLIVVVLVFIICQAPALVNQILWLTLPDEDRECGGFQFYYSRISNFLVMLNSSVNFIIYFCFNTKFRQILLQWICRGGYQKVRTASTTANHYKTEETKFDKTCVENSPNDHQAGDPGEGTNGTQQTSLL